MASILKNYFINFWIWWYLINGRGILLKLTGEWGRALGQLNLIPMLKNMFMPLYQDTSWEGKLVAVPFRLVWSFFGSLIMLVYTLLLLAVYLIYLLMPLLPVAVLVNTFI